MNAKHLEKLALKKYPIPKTRCRTEHRIMKELREAYLKRMIIFIDKVYSA
jgi:hypothetical protein